jgi:hypothetical protein
MQPHTRRLTQIDSAVVAALLGAVSTTVILIGPALRPGYALFLDHIAVPDPARPDGRHLSTPEGLRAWPLSGVSWAWSQLLPAWGFQHLVLLWALLGVGVGSGLVLRRWGWGPALAGSVLAIANPYTVERLLLGQAGLLLAYTSIPWIVLASRRSSSRTRVGLASLACVPAALTPWGGLVAGASAVGVALARRRGPGEIAVQLAVSALLCLPWLVPALRMPPVQADPDGAVAFRLADEGPGVFASALAGGGVWSASAQLPARATAVGVAATAAAVVLAFLGVWAVAKVQRRSALVLALTWLGIPALATLLSGPALELWAGAQTVPGVAVFRDLHRILAPSVLALVLLMAVGLRELVHLAARNQVAARVTLGLLLPASLATMLVPGAMARLHTAYEPRPFSPEWSDVTATIGSPPGRVLSLPWQPLRRTGWMPEPFLDPTSRAFGRTTLSDTTLTVQRDGRTITVRESSRAGTGDDTLVRLLSESTAGPVPAELLATSGITHVLVWNDSPGIVPERPEGWETAFSGSDFVVWSDAGAATR